MPWYSPTKQTITVGETTAYGIVKPFNALVTTSLEPDPYCKLPSTCLRESLLPNGIKSSRANPSTSIKSSCQCTLFNLMTREKVMWATLESYLLLQNPNAKFKQVQSGQQPSVDLQKQSLSFSPIEKKNSKNMQSTLRVSSQPSIQEPIIKSCSMIN